jgi:trimeric autotransporter adhesin
MRTRRLALAAAAAGLLAAGTLTATTTSRAADTPSVTTGAASSITSSSATVAGTVDPNGTPTSYAFQYGTSTGYDEQTSAQSAGSGTSSQNVTVTLNGLPSGTTIHYRIIATYGSGSTSAVVGNDASLTTSGSPPTVPAPSATTGAATSVSAHGAQLNGTVGPTTEGASYYFQYGTSPNYGVETSPLTFSASSQGQAAKATLTSLQAGVTYHYRLVTRSSSGLTSNGVDQTFTTSNAAVPSLTTGPASSITTSSAKVSGTVNPNGTATSYAFQYGTSTSYGAQTSSQSAGSGTSPQNVTVTLNGLPSGTTIHYRVISTYGANSIVVGNDATFRTSGATPTVPAPTATTGAATKVDANGAQVNGTVGNAAYAASYYFQYGLTTSYGVQTSPGTINPSASSQAVTARLNGLETGVTYHYRLVTRSSTGLLAAGTDRTFTTSAPAQRMRPRGLTLSAHSAMGRTRVVLSDYGQLRPPTGVSTQRACHGTVWISVKAGPFTISTRSLTLSGGCGYRERLTFGYRALHHHRYADLYARFLGNTLLLPITSRTTYVRA